jgi:hypothetical protein
MGLIQPGFLDECAPVAWNGAEFNFGRNGRTKPPPLLDGHQAALPSAPRPAPFRQVLETHSSGNHFSTAVRERRPMRMEM